MLLVKALHIGAVAVWFVGLFLLPRLFAARAHAGDEAEDAYYQPLARVLYFRIMTLGAIGAAVLGAVLIPAAPPGAWLAAKLVLVAALLLLHLYLGLNVYDLGRGARRHSERFYRSVSWVPLGFLLAIVALSAAKPVELRPLDPETRREAPVLPREPDQPVDRPDS